MESQDSAEFFRKVLGVAEGASLGGTLQSSMKPLLEPGKGEQSRGGLPQRSFLPGGPGEGAGSGGVERWVW